MGSDSADHSGWSWEDPSSEPRSRHEEPQSVRLHKLSATPKERGAQENWEGGICSHTFGKDEGHQIHEGFPSLDGKAPSKAEGMIGRNVQN